MLRSIDVSSVVLFTMEKRDITVPHHPLPNKNYLRKEVTSSR